MKTIKQHISIHLTRFFVFIALLIVCATNARANDDEAVVKAGPMDSVHVSLLTCSPHQEVYSLYGHTALRVVDERRSMDVAVNYGVFDFNASFFVLRFVFGLTDYEMGVLPFEIFCREYQIYGSEVRQQEIALTAEEKAVILDALAENSLPENRVYRYNFFYDNCTTRARKMITDHLGRKVKFNLTVPEGMTMRKMIHKMNEEHPWARLGNDLLLGVGADQQVSEEHYMALPLWTADAMDSATFGDSNEKVVLSTKVLVEGRQQMVEPEFPLTPTACAIILLFVTAIVTVWEWKSKQYLWAFDGTLMILQGFCGLVLTAMLFSQHPTVRLNIQILLFNPLPLLFGFQAVRCHQRGVKMHWLWLSEAILISLFVLLMSFGVQWIDPSVKIVACCLLLRYCMKIRGMKVFEGGSNDR